jgi:actin-related protein 5
LQGLITATRAEELVHHHCFIANDYINVLSERAWPNITIQLPFTSGASGAEQSIDYAKQEEKDRQRKERARQHLLRLGQNKREEKIRSLEEQLEKLIHLQQLLAVVSDQDVYQSTLDEAGYSSLEAVLKEISSVQEALEELRTRLQETQLKMQGGDGGSGLTSNISNEPVDPQWIQTLQTRKKELLDQKKSRQYQKQEYSKRRSAASQDRMRIISKLAEDNHAKSGHQQEDTFGMDDADWNVYRAIHKPGNGGSDSEKEEAELFEINKLLQKYDPSLSEKTTPVSTESYYQLKLGVELCRTPEVLFQPSMVGIDQCGLANTIEMVLEAFPRDIQQRLVQCVYVCGGSSQFRGIEERLHIELTSMRPYQSHFSIKSSNDKMLGGWKGMALWSRQHDVSSSDDSWFTYSQYKEQGIHYMIEHNCSNRITTIT